MKNFYYAKVRKDLEDLYLVPSRIYRSGKRYRIKRTLNPERISYDLWPKVATKVVKPVFFLAIYQYDTRLKLKQQCNVSLAHMEELAERYTKRNPAFTFTFDPTIFEIDRFDKYGRLIAQDSTKRQPHPRQGFGTAIYRRFTRETYKHLAH